MSCIPGCIPKYLISSNWLLTASDFVPSAVGRGQPGMRPGRIEDDFERLCGRTHPHQTIILPLRIFSYYLCIFNFHWILGILWEYLRLKIWIGRLNRWSTCFSRNVSLSWLSRHFLVHLCKGRTWENILSLVLSLRIIVNHCKIYKQYESRDVFLLSTFHYIVCKLWIIVRFINNTKEELFFN